MSGNAALPGSSRAERIIRTIPEGGDTVRRTASIAIAGLLGLALLAPSASARSHATGAGARDPLGAGHAFAVAYQRSHGYLPIGNSFAAYERNVTKRQAAWARTHPGVYESHPVAGRGPSPGRPR